MLALLCLPFLAMAQSDDSVFELKPDQSMLMLGKGPGQDAAINPYNHSESMAIVTNLGAHPFNVRVQWKGEVIQMIAVAPNEQQTIELYEGYELYLDSTLKGKARLVFQKKKEVP